MPRLLSLLVALLAFCTVRPQGEVQFAELRRQMVLHQLAARDIRDPRVLRAMGKVPRHLFVPAEARPLAYADTALLIGLGQTISQPYIVALMTQLARPAPGMKALEVGTGSGYQAAVLGELVREVYTIEILPELARRAARTLSRLGYSRVHVRTGDGYRGWPEQAPFDVILVTAAAERIPQPLLDQLADGGRLVMPVGKTDEIQSLTVLTRRGSRISKQVVTGVRFVPMTGEVQRPR